jgi:hypothetical protein
MFGDDSQFPARLGMWNDTKASDLNSPESRAWAIIEFIPNFVCGDANGDGTVDVNDLTHLIAYYFFYGPSPPIQAAVDFDNNAAVDLGDISKLAAFLAGNVGLPCDLVSSDPLDKEDHFKGDIPTEFGKDQNSQF